ncbi:unnamed protein product [Rotaria sp. Silwood2]|nr:unnamed protein product [Rotaria sp. Silwood2]CAF4104774.1 unnamed protein product [Rotaria sp. Silwood2]
MSNAVELQFFYGPQSHIINTQLQKQQPASKLVNRYLSTAAQYLNRTKSFHLTTTNNNNNKNNIQEYIDDKNILTNNLAQSTPANMDHINVATNIKVYSNNLLMSINETNSSSLPLNCNNNSIDDNKSQGFVNTLRRSLRKNKERFYNKRSATMKSCHSLNTYEQTMNNHQNIHTKISMTPTLLCRHQHLTNDIETCSIRNIMIDNKYNDQMPPLQPLTINGRDQRNRQLTNGPIAQHQLTSVLPPTSSLQSLSPLNTTINSIGNIPSTMSPVNMEQQSISSDYDEKEKLKNDLQQLKNELQKSKETITRLQKSEEQMRERLAEQAQRQLEKGGKFEDLNQISRPTELIRSYNSLYSQARIDALDALDNVREMSDAEDLKSKLLFSVVVEVENQLWSTLYDYPTLKSCNELLKYINSACRTAWGLANQNPPYYIEFQTTKYDKQIHERFHTSDNESETIIEYIWPCLIDGRDRICVAKGVVITDERYLSMSKNISS